MARLQFHLNSPSLRFTTQLEMVVPECPRDADPAAYYAPEHKLPFMLLLHGAGGNASQWLRYSHIEQLAEEYGFIVACPTAHNSSYMNMAYGHKWADWVYKDVWDFVHATFPVYDDPDHNFIAGLSMGGYGAFRGALQYPEKYGWCVALSSGASIVQEMLEPNSRLDKLWVCAGKPEDGVIGGENDLYAEAERLIASGKKLPHLFDACGTEDFGLAQNIRFRDHLQKLGYEVTWVEDSGAHNWDYWNAHLRMACEWLPLKKK